MDEKIEKEEAELKKGEPYLEGLLPALKRLDSLLERAVAAAKTAYGPDAAIDCYRGLYVSQGEVEQLLKREPGAPALQLNKEEGGDPLPDPMADGSRLDWLQQAFGLSLFDMDLILIALAPELDLRYERLYAYLQDNVSRRRPSVDLALNLLCASAADRLQRRSHFESFAPLIRNHLLHLIPDANQFSPPLLSHFCQLDEQVVNFILGSDSLDTRLVPFCEFLLPVIPLEDVPVDVKLLQNLRRGVRDAMDNGRRLRLYFQGPRGIGRRKTAEALAVEAGLPLSVFDIEKAVNSPVDFKQALEIGLREAWIKDALILFENIDALREEKHAISFRHLREALARDGGITILCGGKPWASTVTDSLGIVTVAFPMPAFRLRRECWQQSLVATGIRLNGKNLDALAGRFRLTPARIVEAIESACQKARMNSSNGDAQEKADAAFLQPGIEALFSAARDQCGHDLAALTHKVTPIYTWDDIVLPGDTLAQLREICQRVTHRNKVLNDWGFGSRLSLGKGVNALFAGPSGTGKTMAAEIIANELKLDLYRIDLSGVVSKYIGETEKNLDRIFTAAENANSILLFDEADALFGKRSEVRDSHDRYANIEISYLLQKMEEYDGLAILATNLRQNLDESFIRRLAFTVHFPFPDEANRRRIWQGIWPAETSRVEDVNLGSLAERFKLSGGNIKNIALAAAFLAAEDGAAVGMNHLLWATRREYQKMGKVLSDAELFGPGDPERPAQGAMQ